MSHIKNYVLHEEDALNQAVIEQARESYPYKIGDCVKWYSKKVKRNGLLPVFL